jgi:undecaprenyl-diphosphatase
MNKAIALAVAALMVGMSCRAPAVAAAPSVPAARTAAAPGRLTLEPGWTDIARIITNLGGAGASVALSAALLAYDPPTGKMMLNATACTAGVVEALKIGLGRARPYVPGDGGRFTGPNLSPDYHSMPSGHTANAFAMATVLSHKHPDWSPVLYGLALAVGLSRIELGVHWPSDVVIGAGIGLFVGTQVTQGRLRLFALDND